MCNEKKPNFFTVPFGIFKKLTVNTIYVTVDAHLTVDIRVYVFRELFRTLSVVLRHTANGGVVVAENAKNSHICLQIRVDYKTRFDNAMAAICPFLPYNS